jgi:hypothetical protein
MQGLWRNNFEGSQYCDQREQCAGFRRQGFVWLEMKHELPGWEDTPPGGLYAIDFIGRRSTHGGIFGGQMMANQEVIVDRLLSIKLIEPPTPSQITKEQVEAYRKECDGAPMCMPNPEVPKHG